MEVEVLEEQESSQTLKDNEVNVDRGPSGLGGWLILIAIGLVITPIILIFTITEYNLPIFNEKEIWDTFADPNSLDYLPLFPFLIYFELIGNVIILLASFFFLYLFFTKKKLFPKVYFWFLIANFAFIFIDEVLTNRMFVFEEFAFRETLRQAFYCAIWLRYLKVSQRVKNTFVN